MFCNTTMASNELIEIDGSILEGGGQILRISTALSCILSKPIHVTNIRANRGDGGLKPQHLTGMLLSKEISNAELKGGVIKSTDITLVPNKIKAGRYIGDTKTAGSVGLLLQSSIPCLLFADDVCKLDLRGGTNAEFSPTIDSYEMVFKPISEKFGFKYDCEILRRGYYPKGGGELHITTYPVKELLPVTITEFGSVKRFYGKAYVAGQLPIKIANTMKTTAEKLIRERYPDVPIQIDSYKEPDNLSIGSGCGIVIVVETTTGCLLEGSGLGRKGLPSEEVAQTAVRGLLEDLRHEACVDQHVQDQLIIFMALANGASKIKSGPLTLHTKTAIYVTELMTNAKFNVTAVNESAKEQFYIECTGIGHKNPYMS